MAGRWASLLPLPPPSLAPPPAARLLTSLCCTPAAGYNNRLRRCLDLCGAPVPPRQPFAGVRWGLTE